MEIFAIIAGIASAEHSVDYNDSLSLGVWNNLPKVEIGVKTMLSKCVKALEMKREKWKVKLATFTLFVSYFNFMYFVQFLADAFCFPKSVFVYSANEQVAHFHAPWLFCWLNTIYAFDILKKIEHVQIHFIIV